ncbi:MAG: electron transport complex subunit RsxB [Gammaproteobacteria bacterium]|nr:electron transport complex subunit RsxB [Gammaproteobacteria bacterium]
MGSAEFLTQLPAALATLATLAVLAAAVFGRATHADRDIDIDIDIGIQGLQTAERELAAQIEDLLPQTQCGQCGHPGCRPYARAVAAGEPFNKCPPGGHATIAAIADLLGTPPLALDPEHGREGPKLVAYIREAECIGCTKCLPACPVDAILGAPRQMHTVIAAECTGCDLCVEPCPVDCIEMIPAPVRSALMARDQRPPVAA